MANPNYKVPNKRKIDNHTTLKIQEFRGFLDKSKTFFLYGTGWGRDIHTRKEQKEGSMMLQLLTPSTLKRH